jgi:hypothetical protein
LNFHARVLLEKEEITMKKLSARQLLVVALFGLVGWALCGAIMFIGMEITSMETTLISHAVGAPIIFTTISWIYFTRFGYTKPLSTAAAFVAIVIIVDFFLVALVINRSLEMFESLLGTWIPWALIFLSTYLTGLVVESRSTRMQEA